MLQTTNLWPLVLTFHSVALILKTKSSLQVVGNICLVTIITHVLTPAPRLRARRCGRKKSGFSTMSAALGSLIAMVATLSLPRVTELLAYHSRSRAGLTLPLRPLIRGAAGCHRPRARSYAHPGPGNR